MIFALDMEEGIVIAFEAEEDAALRCKPVDVEDGYWRFYADDGSPLDARFFRPEGLQMPAAAFSLQRALSGLWLQERLAQVKEVQGLEGLAALEETLRANRAMRIARDRLAARPGPPASGIPDE